jgi:hypothetical protein
MRERLAIVSFAIERIVESYDLDMLLGVEAFEMGLDNVYEVFGGQENDTVWVEPAINWF